MGIMRDETGPTVLAITVYMVMFMVLLTMAIIGLAHLGTRYSCQETERLTTVDTHYSLASGCLVRVNNEWVPYDRWIENSGN